MNIIGVDLGTSATKIVQCDENGDLINTMFLTEKSFSKAFDKFISSFNINIERIDKIILTGVGSSRISETKLYNIDIVKIDEFIGIAEGAKALVKKDSIIISSIGTGTAFIRADGNNISHIGGSGIGGGTLINLCKKFLNLHSFEEIVNLSSSGNLYNVDLSIGDITSSEIKTLPKDITAANFAKLNNNATDSDIALGIINMIFETVGMLAVFATKNDSIKEVVAIGGLTKIPHIHIVFDKIEKFCDIKFTIPNNAEFATCFGVVQHYLKLNEK